MAPAQSLHPASLDEQALRAQCRLRRTRGSGPGGQNRNKLETAVVLTHEPTGITATASERRSQGENLKVALFRLRVNLALAYRVTRHQGTEAQRRERQEASAVWQARCRNGRIVVNPRHPDFPGLLAEVLDVLTTREFDVKAVADGLNVSMSQLVKFLKLEPRALAQVNRQRVERGVHALR